MRCASCGEKVPEGPEAPERCERCGGEPHPSPRGGPAGKASRGETPGGRAFRLLTSLVDRPADPAMVDESPPFPARPSLSDLETGGEGGTSGRESVVGDRLEEDAPVAPGEIRPPLAGQVPPAEERSVNEKPHGRDAGMEAEASGGIADFGEAREAPPAAEARGVPGGGAAGAAWGDQWETELREQMRKVTPPRLPKGGFWVRVTAVSIDGLFLSLLGSIAFTALYEAIGLQQVIAANLDAIKADPSSAVEILRPAIQSHLGAVAITYFAVSLAWFLYRPVCHAAWGKTLGKLVLGLRVIRTDGSRLGLGRAFLRYVGYMIALVPLGLGCLWVAWDRQKQGWHDKLADTYVIKERG